MEIGTTTEGEGQSIALLIQGVFIDVYDEAINFVDCKKMTQEKKLEFILMNTHTDII